MELTKDYLIQKAQEYRQQAERLKADALANKGAADAIELLLRDLEVEGK